MNYDSEIDKIEILNGGMMAKETKDHTFSLVEYLMIVMIVGILIVFIVPFTEANKAQPKISEMKNNVNSILKAYDQTGVIEELKLSQVEALNNQELKYSMNVNDFLKYVNFEKDFTKNYLAFTKKGEYYNFLRSEVRPLVKVAYLSKFDKYVNDLAKVKINFDYDVLPNLGSFLEDDKFFEYYDLAENRLKDFAEPSNIDGFNSNIIATITFVKGLKPIDNEYHLTYDQIKNFSNINLIDIQRIEDKYFAYKLYSDSTIVATSTENFGTSGAQIFYNMTDEIYEVGPKADYLDLGPRFLDESISKLPTLSQERENAITQFKNSIRPEEVDLNISLIAEKDRELFLNFENYVKENFRYQDNDIYLEFYQGFISIVDSGISNNKASLENAVVNHDKMRNPSDNAKAEISLKVEEWEKLNQVKAKIESRIKSLKDLDSLIDKVETAENHQSLKESYLKSFNVIDQDWLILQ
ncbi:hypothetical protein JEZ13_03505 [bacterium]|nr:hypothetical protein [bacterium]